MFDIVSLMLIKTAADIPLSNDTIYNYEEISLSNQKNVLLC